MLKIYTTAPTQDPRDARHIFPTLEEAGYDGAFSFEAKHDPFLPLVLAAERTQRLDLGTAIAIAFARNPMTLANADTSSSPRSLHPGPRVPDPAPHRETFQLDLVEASRPDA